MSNKIALVFSGIGTQWQGMAASLLANDAVFCDAVAELDALLTPLQRWSLMDLLSGRDAGVALERPEISHPAIFAVQYGLSACLRRQGLRPAAVIGHSAGEVAAAVCAGALTLADAAALVAAHSELIRAVTPGAMMHVALDPHAVTARIAAMDSGLELAAINSHQAAVVAGEPQAISAFEAALKADGIDCRVLAIQVPFHTPAVEPHLAAFRQRIAALKPLPLSIDFYSSWRGGLAQGGDFTAEYWARHIRQPVQFLDAAHGLLASGITHCIEVSPHPALLQHMAAIANEAGLAPAMDAIMQRGVPEPSWPQLVPAAAVPAHDAAALALALQEVASEVLGGAFSLHEAEQLKWTELGCTSLQITQLMAKLSARLERPLSVTLPYRFPTPAALIAGLAAAPAPADTAVQTARHDEPVAVIGMACRFPGGADNPEALWRMLASGVDPIGEIPAERWPADEFYDADRTAKGRSVSRWGGFISGQDLRDFDARHFRMTPREASALDPQQRLLLEVTWEALENAGLSVPALKGKRVGVYVGLSTDDYKNSTLYSDDLDALDPYAGAGAMSCTASGRLSYFFGWEGPNIALDTACSSSLVALHLACQALQAGECDLAVAGGVNALLTPHLYVYFSKAGIMSPTGRCHVFDDSADGYVRAEGCGILVLQRESDAVSGGHRMRARVLGSAINQDGASTGFSAPNGASQQKVLRQAWQQAGIAPADLGYLEAHGTGTPIGDPIELEAMAQALAPQRTPQDPVLVGSIKSNLGHLEAAAGAAALIKTVLALEHQSLPANLHFNKPNSHIDWPGLPLRVVDRHQPWPMRGGRRIAGISSFGFSGTNAHAVLEQALPRAAAAPVRQVQVLALSAPDQAGLRHLARQYAQRIAACDRSTLADLACTTHLARPFLAARVALAGKEPSEIAALLAHWADDPAQAGGEQIFSGEGDAGPLVFAFTGQGCQYPGMAKALYESEAVFRAVLDRCEAALLGLRGSGMLGLMLDAEADAEALASTDLAQPAIFAMQCGIVALLDSWGIRPDRVIGHSVGEFAAAVAAGVLTLEDALALVAQRGSLMGAMPAGGAMASVQVDQATAEQAIGEQRSQVALAAINGPRAVVLSGDAAALDMVLARLGTPGTRAKRLAVSHAYHSPLMAPAAAAFAQLAAPAFKPAQLTWISCVDGGDLSKSGVDMQYWTRQILSPVHFDQALSALEAEGCRCFVEIGPAAVLTQMGRARDGAAGRLWIQTQQRQQDGAVRIAAALAAIAASGRQADWAGYDDPAGRRRVDLPPYPFQRKRHWREPLLPHSAATATIKPEGAPYAWLNRYALWRLAAQLHSAGLLSQTGAGKQHASCIKLLAKAGLASIEHDTATLTASGQTAVALPGLAQERTRFLAAHPSLEGCLALLDDCLDHYPAIIRGELDPLTVLFPRGSMDRVESVYANNEVQDLFNRDVARTVARWCQGRIAATPGQTLRIVEIGAGTGATTAAVLAALPQGAPVEYYFTDVSPAFLSRAKKRFGQINFALLNIERDPGPQGFPAGVADLVIANNVLHATADIGVTLANVRWLSAAGSALVLNEQTDPQAFIHLIFGLTDGWWRFTDALRQGAGSPILSRQLWTEALQQAGFDVSPEVFSTDAGQTVFVANIKDAEMVQNAHASSAQAAPAMDAILEMVAELTGMGKDEIDADTALIDLGLDSLMLVQMKTLLSNRLGLEVDMADFYGDMDSVSRLAQAVPVSAAAAVAVAPPVSKSVQIATATNETPSPLQGEGWGGGRDVNQQPPVVHQPHNPLPSPPPARGRELPGAGAAPSSELTSLIALQLETMSRMISEQNALLARAPAPAPAHSQNVQAVAPAASPAPAIAAPVQAASATATTHQRPSTPNFRSLKLEEDKFTPQQKAFVDSLAQRYAARTPGSKALADATRHTLADWKNTLSFRYSLKEMMYPIVAAKSHGSHFTDIDGNDFLDVTMGCGIALLGHSPKCVTDAVHAQVDANFAIGPQTALASEVAQRFSRITGMERVTFCNTGAEAVMMAVRIARAVTGRNKIVIFNGAYHGTWDGVLGVEHEGRAWPIAAGIPQGMVDDLMILNYGTDEAVAAVREHAHELAAVLVEPVQSRRPGLQPKEFLQQLRSITSESGSALIFDEMITGFRILPGGAQAHYGIRADLATYGKIVGGGLPLSVVAGSARFMDVVDGGDWQYGDASKPESDVIYFGGTYVKHPLALAAAKASLDFLEAEGSAGYEQLNRRTARMAETLNAWFARESVPLTVAHFGSLFRIDGVGRYSGIMQPVELDLFFLLMNLRSVYIWERRVLFLSFAHTDAEVDHLIACVKDAVQELRAAGFEFRAGGKPPAPVGGIQLESSLGRLQSARTAAAQTIAQDVMQDCGPAASAQRRMFALAEIEGPSVVYNVPLAIRLRGKLDLPRLEKSLAQLVARHPALRTCFAVEDDVLLQKVAPSMPFAIKMIECPDERSTNCLAHFVQPFDLKSTPLFRAGLLRIGADHHVLIMDAHHIVVDGLSLNILAQELMAYYGGQALPEPGATMLDHAAAEAAYLASDACSRDAAYWQSEFRSIPEPLQLPVDQPRPLRRRHKGADLLSKLDSAATARLKAAARANKMSIFPLVLTLYATLLHRLCAQDDIVIGLPVGGRTDPRFRNTVGMLAATLPLRLIAAPKETLGACARAYQKTFLNALGHQAYPLEALIASLDLPRDTSRNPLFDTMFIYEDGNDRVYRMSGLECETAEVSRHAAMFDIAMEVVEAEGELTLRCEYDVDLFSEATAQSVLDAYIRLLHLAPDMLDQPIGELSLVDNAQRATLLAWGDGGPAPAPGTVLQAFDVQLARAPDAPALVSAGKTLSYRELDQMANRLAHTLLDEGPLSPDTPVALVSHRDAGLLAGLLAILRAGCAYVPVDPDFPPDRVRLMLQAGGCRHLLVSSDLVATLPALPGSRVLCLDAPAANAPSTPPNCNVVPEQLAYVIFTSGSTGTPKGTMLRHRNAAAFFACLPQVFGFTAVDRILGVTTVSFDIAALELLGALCCGMTVVLASAEQARDPAQLLDLMQQEHVNVLQMTPTRLRMLLEAGNARGGREGEGAGVLCGIRTLLVGGEALPQALAEQLLPLSHLRVFNVYGPTETTIWSASWQLSQGPVSLGRALPGERLLILSPQHRLQPAGAVGEIAIAGAGVARGYLNDAVRTAERFISLPDIEGPVYLTGDLGRWRSDGSLEFLGRRDDQIKIRGMRIEIGEIEHHLRQLPAVQDAAAAVRKNALGEAEIVAYLVGPKENVDAAALRTAMAAHLPGPMIPARFVVLQALPQTPNGKTDRRALPAPEPQTAAKSARAPEGPIETAITAIFSEVLGQNIGPDDDFFLSGGESIRSLRLASRIRALELAFDLQDLFRWPTPAALAANLKPLRSGTENKDAGVGELSGLSASELADLLG